MPDEYLDPRDLPEIATLFVCDWISMKGTRDPALSEAMAIVRSGISIDRAAEELKRWFRDRLTIYPEAGSPFADLGYNLISAMLGMVDWKFIIREMRQRED